MSPDNSLGMLIHHAETLADRVNDGSLNDDVVTSLLESVAGHWCDPSVKSVQLILAQQQYQRRLFRNGI